MKTSNNAKFMRDPTRGGLATTLNEITDKTKLSIEIDEGSIPVSKGVKSACELLGFDPLYIANEGKLIVVVSNKDANRVLSAMRKNRLGKNSSIIGEVKRDKKAKVILKTRAGGTRIVDMLVADQLPRIC
jgi:hydrogenase expression/formation protein HypE